MICACSLSLPRLHHFLGPITLWLSDIRLFIRGLASVSRKCACLSVAAGEIMCEREILVQCIARWKSRSIANERRRRPATAASSEDAKDEFVVVLNRHQGQTQISFSG